MSEKKERIQLGDHFEYGRIIRFVFPSIVMMVFTSIYTIVDGLFVSNFAGTVPFAAINLIMPVFIIVGALGFMLGAGGSALVSQKLGEKKPEEANRYFSLFVYTVMVGGVVMSALGQLALRQVSIWLGASGELLDNCVLYGRIMLCSMVFFMLQNLFQSFMVAAEKPRLGLVFTVSAGVINMVLDALFVGLLGWGLAGAAFATLVAETFGGLVPVIYFLRPNDSLLQLGRTRVMWPVLWKATTNGSSEMMNSIAASVVTILYNKQLLRLAGSDGVAAYGVIMYVVFIFLGVFMGYAVGIAPVFSFHYGAGHKAELRSLFRKTMVLLSCAGVLMTAVSWALSGTLTDIFVGYDADLRAMTLHGMRIFVTCFLLSWFVVFGSSFFTALGNGLISATISFLRTLVFECGSVLLLPMILGLNGVWGSIVVAEVMACVVTGVFLLKKRKEYFYD